MIARCAQRRVNSVSLSNLRLLPRRRTKPVVTGDDTLVSRLAARSLIEHSELKSATVGPILVIINQGWAREIAFSLCSVQRVYAEGVPGWKSYARFPRIDSESNSKIPYIPSTSFEKMTIVGTGNENLLEFLAIIVVPFHRW